MSEPPVDDPNKELEVLQKQVIDLLKEKAEREHTPGAPDVVPDKSSEKDKDPKTGKKKDKVKEETVSKKDYMSVQKQVLDLQKEKQQSDADKEELDRTYAMNELKRLSPQLAKINEKSSADTLKTVISTLTEVKKDFPSLKDAKKGADDLTPKIEGIVGFRDPSTGKWKQNPDYL